jgi:hypothetical protein
LLGLVAGAGLAEAAGVCADLEVAAVGEPVDDGPLPAFFALGQDLEETTSSRGGWFVGART